MAKRIYPPSETWTRIKPLFPYFGITRIGDITGLDRIGVPVWIAVRPNSRTLSVSQGKGLDAWAARVSAAMESLETAIAERPRLELELATLTDLAAAEVVVDVARLPRPSVSLFGEKRPLFWTRSSDWCTGQTVWVPYELVHADATVPALPGSGSFLPSTNGLASGNCLNEAVLHGLCEVIERDALALWDHLPRAAREERRLDLTSGKDPVAVDLLERFARADILPTVWEVTSDVEVATFRAVICDDLADPVFHPFPAAFGAGCHPDRAIALCRALTEAAQSRLTVISGSRDDFGRSRYAQTQSERALAYNSRIARSSKGTRPFDSAPDAVLDTLADEVDYVVERLRAARLSQVLYVELGDPSLPISVARVIVPGLEGPTEAPLYYPGARVRSLVAGLVS